jgi:hypothetical protein
VNIGEQTRLVANKPLQRTIGRGRPLAAERQSVGRTMTARVFAVRNALIRNTLNPC